MEKEEQQHLIAQFRSEAKHEFLAGHHPFPTRCLCEMSWNEESDVKTCGDVLRGFGRHVWCCLERCRVVEAN
jgi:hypothetical protein